MMKLFSPSKQLLIDFVGCLLGVHSDYNSFLNFLKQQQLAIYEWD